MSWSFLINPFIRWIMPMECHFTAWMMTIMWGHGGDTASFCGIGRKGKQQRNAPYQGNRTKDVQFRPLRLHARRDLGGVHLLSCPRFMPRRHKKVGPKADSLHTITGFPYLRYLPSTPTLPGPFSTQTRAE